MTRLRQSLQSASARELLTLPQLRKKSPDEAMRRGRRDQEVRFQPNERCEGIAPGIQEYLSRCRQSPKLGGRNHFCLSSVLSAFHVSRASGLRLLRHHLPEAVLRGAHQ